VKTSVFGGSASAASPFASASPFGSASALTSSAPAAKPTLSFGQASASPFASAKPSANGFGSGASTGFGGFGGSSLQSKPLSSFAKPGESFKSEKPAKPFGAPDSDAEESADEEGGDDGQSDDGGDDVDAKEESDKEEAKVADEKKKKLQRSMDLLAPVLAFRVAVLT
jgi:Ran-binding protein 3